MGLIQKAAHMAALQNMLGRTIAVIGTGLGVFVLKPIKTSVLYCKNHLVLSEYQCGEPAFEVSFPEQVIIAVCARGVIVAG